VERFAMQTGSRAVTIRSQIAGGLRHKNMDPDMVARAVANILKNALEANGDRGEVRFRAEREDDAVRIDIEDQGSGIDPSDLHRIFEPFYTTRSKGTGLGLAYAHQVVTLHRGTIIAQNREAGGACFRIEIPLPAS
jgi:two-component system, NtrC family, sensor histidine kinase HydH